MKYYIEKNNQSYKLSIPMDGIVTGRTDTGLRENFKLEEISTVFAIDEKEIKRKISKQQWLLETNSLNTANEWHSNSHIIFIFLGISAPICQLLLVYLGLSFTIWMPVLLAVGFIFSFIGYKKTKRKLYLFSYFINFSLLLTILSIIK